MLRNFFALGGFMMWPLLACSVFLLAVLIERIWTIFIKQKLLGLDQKRGIALHRKVLPFFQDIPPSLGLLGTVIGIVQSFSLLDGRLNADAVGSGLAVACITTIFGLSIAIFATICSYFFDWAVARHEDRGRRGPRTEGAAA